MRMNTYIYVIFEKMKIDSLLNIYTFLREEIHSFFVRNARLLDDNDVCKTYMLCYIQTHACQHTCCPIYGHMHARHTCCVIYGNMHANIHAVLYMDMPNIHAVLYMDTCMQDIHALLCIDECMPTYMLSYIWTHACMRR